MDEPFRTILKGAVEEEHEKMLRLNVTAVNSGFPSFKTSGGGIEALGEP